MRLLSLRSTLLRCPSPHSARRGGGRTPTTLRLIQEGRLLIGAVNDRRRIELQPFVEDRRVDAAEVHVRVHIALNQMLGLQGRHLPVMTALDLLAEHEGDTAGALVGAGAVVADATADLRA